MVSNFPKRLIICASGNSVQEGLDKGLADYLQYEYSIGLNAWYQHGPETTWTSWIDWQFYRNHYKTIKDLPLLIGKKDPSLRDSGLITGNTFTLKIASSYSGKNSWENGFYTSKLVGLFALTLGIALEFKEIYLLGYDSCEVNGKTHFYQDNIDLTLKDVDKKDLYRGVGKKKDPRGNEIYRTSHYNTPSELNKWFDIYKPELERIKIINVSEHSIIDTFPKISYDEFFKILKDNKGEVVQSRAREQIKEMVNKRIKK